jgi:hypothetical protein
MAHQKTCVLWYNKKLCYGTLIPVCVRAHKKVVLWHTKTVVCYRTQKSWYGKPKSCVMAHQYRSVLWHTNTGLCDGTPIQVYVMAHQPNRIRSHVCRILTSFILVGTYRPISHQGNSTYVYFRINSEPQPRIFLSSGVSRLS